MATQSLQAVNRAIQAALGDEDLEALALALEQRQLLLSSGVALTAEDLNVGEAACRALLALKRRLHLEHARLDQLRSGFLQTVEEEPYLIEHG